MNIFKKIECISNELGSKMGKNESEDYQELYSYSIFAILSQVFTFGVGFVISIFCDYTLIYIFLSLTFILLRSGAGGYHCNTFCHCFLTTNSMLCIASLATVYTYQHYEYLWYIAMFIGVFVLPVCPKASINAPSRGVHIDLLFRKKYRTILLICLLVSTVFIYLEMYDLSVAIDYGIILSSIFVSNSGERFFSYFWSSLE